MAEVGFDEAAHLRRVLGRAASSLGHRPSDLARAAAQRDEQTREQDVAESPGVRATPQLRRRRRRPKQKRRGRIVLAAVVDEVLRRHVPDEVQRLSRLRNLWIERLPTGFADHVWPMLIQGGRLVVHVHDSQWLHEMTYWRQEVLVRLRAVWPEIGIEIIEAYVGPIPPLAERRPPPPAELPKVDREPVLEPEVPVETVDALNAIRDPKLREALAQARMMLGKPR